MNTIVGNYKILRSIGKGGMGEVFLAHDPVCGRNVALKQMHPEWAGKKVMQGRFLREARIAAQLSHPSIIPIYAIEGTFYTMPHIEGETLKAILRTTREQAKNGESLHHIGASIPALIRIFLSVCGAIAYAHARGVLHRDLKPENIIVGKYGEVIILDWGLADFIDHPEKNGLDFEQGNDHLTQPGKIPGTLQYMAPERAFEEGSSVLTDIYSLGVILYQVLTLKLPFHRTSLKEFRKAFKHESMLDPEEAAPDREISPQLSTIAKKCLAKDQKNRYQTVEGLISDLEDYIEGLPEWIDAGKLQIEDKGDWQFQENVVLAKHMAITRGVDILEWVNLMISKASFPGNIKIETQLTLKKASKGLGILFCLPESETPKELEEGYCLWLGGREQGIRLYRRNVEVLVNKQVFLEPNRLYKLCIEKIDNHVYFLLDGEQRFSFLSHIPLSGTHLGLLLRDADFTLSDLRVFVGSQNIMVNCLAVPDAFLVRKDFAEALREYRKIADSFPGRAEGREATFRAGLSLLQQAQTQHKKSEREALFAKALDEFEKLHSTPGAPLEYLGKALVYKAQNEVEEEVKCLELSLRKFPKHPLKPILVENIISRLHESSQSDRRAAYHFALMTLRHLPHIPDTHAMLDILQKHLEPLPFFLPSEKKEIHSAIELAFWLNKPLALVEMLEKGLEPTDVQNAQIALIQLGQENLSGISMDDFSEKTLPIFHLLFDRALRKDEDLSALFKNLQKSLVNHISMQALQLWALLQASEWEKASQLINTIPNKVFQDEMNPLFFLYGCFLAKEKGEEQAVKHLTSVAEKAHPPTSLLLSHFLMGRINLEKGWMDNAFFWEKLRLLQQLHLFYHCLGSDEQKNALKSHIKKISS